MGHRFLSEHTRGGRRRGHDARPGHGRHRARRGAIRSAVLTLLAERPMHGYELITELDERSSGRWRPSPGAMYPALARLEEHGLIASEDDDGKRRFRLTDEGRARLAELVESQGDDSVAPWDDAGTGSRGELRHIVAELTGQARQIGRFGTSAQIDRAAGVLADAKRALYAILADDAAADDAADDDADDDDTPS